MLRILLVLVFIDIFIGEKKLPRAIIRKFVEKLDNTGKMYRTVHINVHVKTHLNLQISNEKLLFRMLNRELRKASPGQICLSNF